MKIDFNNCRRNAGVAYNDLVKFLTEHIQKFGGCEQDELYDIVGDLRSFIGTIMCVYVDGNDEFKDMYGDPELLRFEIDVYGLK